MNTTKEHPRAFFEWLDAKLAERNWSDRELCRRAGVASSIVSKARNSAGMIGLDAGVKLAEALDVPPDMFLRLAGLLPPDPDDSAERDEWAHLIEGMPADEVAKLIAMARAWRAAVIGQQKGKKGK